VTTIRVVVADDHYVFREGLRSLLATVPGIEVVGEAGATDEAVAVCLDLLPDVVVMDLRMPGAGGVAATEVIARSAPQVRVLVLTMHAEDAVVRQALRAGARGYLLKDAGPDEIIRAITALHADQAILDPQVASAVFHAAGRSADGDAPAAFRQLTDRERDVLARVARGHTNLAIATALGLSIKTVQNHVSNILLKFGVSDRAQAVVAAHDAGLDRLRPS
jgi:DNA-binding NarL/FixJ family response regulator